MEEENKQSNNAHFPLDANSTGGAAASPSSWLATGDFSPDDYKRMKRVNHLWFFGVLCIILGFLSLFVALMYYIRPFTEPKFDAFPLVKSDMGIIYYLTTLILGIFAKTLIFFGGFGLAKCKNLGRITVIAGVWILIALLSVFIAMDIYTISAKGQGAKLFQGELFNPITTARFVIDMVVYGISIVVLFVFVCWLASKKVREVCKSSVRVSRVRKALNKKPPSDSKTFPETIKTAALAIIVIFLTFGGLVSIFLYSDAVNLSREWVMSAWTAYSRIAEWVFVIVGFIGIVGGVLLAVVRNFGRILTMFASWVYMILYAGFFVMYIIIVTFSPGWTSAAKMSWYFLLGLLIAVIVLLFYFLSRWLKSERVKHACQVR